MHPGDDAAAVPAPYRAPEMTDIAAAPAHRATPLSPRLPGWVRLVAPAAACAFVQVAVVAVATGHQAGVRPLDWWAILLLVAGPAALLLRTRWPVACLVAAFVPTMAYWLTDYARGPVFLALLVAYVNAVMRGHRRVAWASLVAGWVVTGWIAPAVRHEGFPDWGAIAGVGAWLVALAAGVELIRSRREQAAEAEAIRAEEARRQASEERLRIAQELHDVLAHDISLITVQAGVALHLLDEHPEQARPALTVIRDASRDALGELRSVLDILRMGEAAPRQPTAGLADLPALVERTRSTGLDVAVDGVDAATAGGLPPGVDLAAFRVVQEAVTNVVRHAGAGRATIRFARRPGELVVQVDDDGRGPTRGDAPAGGGRGIAGMRERARALGGRLEAGPRPGLGFRVRACFPLPPDGDGSDSGGDERGDG
jgi:signal transduction histidine kinase